jgi:hypothetical protein
MLSRSLLLLALAGGAAAVDLTNPGFETVDAAGRPSGWTAYAWERPRDGLTLATAGEAAEGQRCLRLAATASGAVGAISAPVAIGAEPVALRVRLRLRASADYAGNQPWIFLSCHQDGKFLGIAQATLPELTPGAWTAVDALVPADALKPGTTSVHLNLATRRHGEAAPAGSLDCDQVALAEDLAAPAITIACDRFASWTVVGQAATFAISKGRLPPRTRQVKVQVEDSAGAVVLTQAVPAAEFTARGWSWTPAIPGWYDLAFTADSEREGATLAIPLGAGFAVRAPSKRDLRFTRERWSLAVAAEPTRPMAERSPQFGFSYQLGPEEEIRLADLLGLSFARIHAIPWGSQFANPKQAIEPERGVYRWGELDQKVGWLTQRGFAMVGNVLYTPQWASPHPEDTKIDICVPGFAAWAPKDLGDWTRFLEKLVERYGDRIRTWELWNEPHLPGGSCFWHDTPQNYVAMLKAGYATLKRVQPDSEVWIGGIGMRYVPFYRQLVKLGGGTAFDRLALHGAFCDPAPFAAIDRAAGLPAKPWANSEQHGILLNPGNEIPDERVLAKRLVLDSFGQLARGAQRLALFQIPEYMEKEVLEPARAEGWFIHSSGLFRARPRVEPRLAAVVWQNVVAQVQPGMRIRSQHRLGEVRVLACDNGGGDLLLAWHDQATPLPVPVELAKAGARAAATLDWEGRPVPSPWNALAPATMYLIRHADPALVAALPAGEALPAPTRRAGPSPDAPRGEATWGPMPAQPRLTSATAYEAPASAESLRAGFAVAGDAAGLELLVEVADPDHHSVDTPGKHWQGDSVQIAIDTGGACIDSDQVQFQIALTKDGPVVWKDVAPYIGGDLPSGWTPAGRAAAHAKAEITAMPGGLRYRIRIAAGELYPLAIERDQPLRFSVLVNSNRGQGRAGWTEWGAGIGKERDPGLYGSLTWR